MVSQRKDWTNYLKEFKYKKVPIPRSFRPTGNMAIAQIAANWFNNLIEGRGDIPDRTGNITFEVPYTILLHKLCVEKISSSLRKHLKRYGFTLKRSRHHNAIEVTKHS